MWWLIAGVLIGLSIAVVLLKRSVRIEAVKLVPPPADTTDPEALLRGGRKVEAIKRYRELSGVGLREAKEAIEALERGLAPLPRPVPPGLPPSHRGGEPMIKVADDVIEHEIRMGNLINAIKLYREQRGVGLREAKEAVEAWKHRLRSS